MSIYGSCVRINRETNSWKKSSSRTLKQIKKKKASIKFNFPKYQTKCVADDVKEVAHTSWDHAAVTAVVDVAAAVDSNSNQQSTFAVVADVDAKQQISKSTLLVNSTATPNYLISSLHNA